MIALIRCLLFNIVFYGMTAILCVVFLPALILPRKYFIYTVQLYFYTISPIMRYILGLKLEVRGKENIPKEGSYIIASKHQSAYETLKLFLIFKDPAIVYKKELTWIPLWGWFMLKAKMIPIDRKKSKSAMQSIIDNAQHVVDEDRPIAIFPQGTRVALGEQKPYKYGFMRLYTKYNIPIVPVALNTGYFWGKNAFFKKGGTAVIEILPAVEPGKDPAVVFEMLQRNIEDHSDDLLKEARERECFGHVRSKKKDAKKRA